MKQYSTDLTDSQWRLLEGILNDNRNRKHSLREIFNAIFYLFKTGCQWRMLPNDFPKWQLVYYYFTKWKNIGVIEQAHDIIRDKIRKKSGKHISPSLACIDSQSIKTIRLGGEARGIDGGKKINGRKRHIITDTMGLLLVVVVHAANVHDSKGAFDVIKLLHGRFGRLIKIAADGGYRGQLIERTKKAFGYVLDIVLRTDFTLKFEVLPKRWIVERTFSWFESYRRLSKDFEYKTDTSEAMIQIAMMKLMLNRIK